MQPVDGQTRQSEVSSNDTQDRSLVPVPPRNDAITEWQSHPESRLLTRVVNDTRGKAPVDSTRSKLSRTGCIGCAIPTTFFLLLLAVVAVVMG